MKILGVIPARYASSRFPGKPLADIAGMSMIRRVHTQVSQASGLADFVVATDDARIEEHVLAFGGRVCMTSSAHPTGTDRLLEVAAQRPEYDAYINIQGDEPFIDPEQINAVCRMLAARPGAFVATLVRRLHDLRGLDNPNTVKAVLAADGRALYFSRSPIPFMREPAEKENWHARHGFWHHVGIYGYTSPAIEAIRGMQAGALEQAESLEQLRWMENGLPIYASETTAESHPVDTPEDILNILRLKHL